MVHRPGQPFNVLLYNILWGTCVCITLKHWCSIGFSNSINRVRVTQCDVCGAGVGAPVKPNTHSYMHLSFLSLDVHSYHSKTPTHGSDTQLPTLTCTRIHTSFMTAADTHTCTHLSDGCHHSSIHMSFVMIPLSASTQGAIDKPARQ